LLANLFLHYTVDVWMQKHYPEIPFERYADDGVPRRRAGGRSPPCSYAA
jgi:RNA-directed DNA polymerase